MSFDLVNILKGAAPTLAEMIGGPGGKLAYDFIAGAFGVEPTEEAISAAIQKDPDALLKLRELEFKYREKELDFEAKRLELEAADRASARAREIAVRDWVPSILAFLIVGGYFAANWIIFTVGVPDGTNDFVLRSLGTMDGLIFAVIGFYFGAMHQGKQK